MATNGVFYSDTSGLNLNTSGTTQVSISTGGVIEFNQSYAFPTTDGSTNEVLLTNGAGVLSFSTIPNSSLDNSSITIGSTSINLGSTSTTLAGLTSVTSTSFTGSLTGNASTATKWVNARTITLGNSLSGSVSIDGSSNVTLNASITSGAVGTTELANGSVTTAKITDGNVTTAKIANGNITDAKLASNSVTTVKILDANVTTAKIANSNVTADKLASNSVTTAKITDGNVTNAKLANSTITITDGGGSNSTEIALGQTITISGGTGINSTENNGTVRLDIDSSVVTLNGTQTLTNKTINGSQLVDSSVTNAKLATNSVTTVKITDGNVTADKLASNSVTTAKITDGNVTTDKLASNSVTTVKILDANVTTAKIANSNVTADKLASNSVTTAKITDGNVTADKLASNSVTTVKILDANVTTAKIANGNITAEKLATDSVTNAKIENGAITTLKITDAAVTNDKLANSNIAFSNGSNSTEIALGDTFTISGGTGINSTVDTGIVTLAIDSSVVTLNGAQTLTNKTINGSQLVNSSVTNAKLQNSSVTVTAGNGLTNGGSVSLGSSTTINVGAGTGISVNSNSVSVNLSDLTTSTSNNDGDFFVVVDTSNVQKKLTKGSINISGFNNDAGYITSAGNTNIYNTNGTLSGSRTLTQNNNNLIFLSTADEFIAMASSPDPNGSPRVLIQGDSGYSSSLEINSGDFSVDLIQGHDEEQNNVFAVDGKGNLTATSKAFDIPHPNPEKKQQGLRLRHGNLEGPEHGVYIRGRLVNGKEIELPDYWEFLVDENTITVQLTSIGSHQNLYVKKIENNKIYVGNGNLLSSKIDCYYYIQAERKDIDKIDVEYKK